MKEETFEEWEEWFDENNIKHNGTEEIPEDYIYIGGSWDEIYDRRKPKNEKFFEKLDNTDGKTLYLSNMGEETYWYDLGKFGDIFQYTNENLKGWIFFSNKTNFNRLYK